jgi:hypothetical protein
VSSGADSQDSTELEGEVTDYTTDKGTKTSLKIADSIFQPMYPGHTDHPIGPVAATGFFSQPGCLAPEHLQLAKSSCGRCEASTALHCLTSRCRLSNSQESQVLESTNLSSTANARTKLSSTSRSFQPMHPTETRMNAIVSAAHLLLVSCVPGQCLKVEQELTGKATTSFIIDLKRDSTSASTAEDIVQLVKKALDDVVKRVGLATVLNAKVCKNNSGCNLYSTIVCWPQGLEENMCWDLLNTGSCPRRKKCRWHHPQPSEKMRINVLISEKQSAKESQEQVLTSSHPDRHKIHLNQLVQ